MSFNSLILPFDILYPSDKPGFLVRSVVRDHLDREADELISELKTHRLKMKAKLKSKKKKQRKLLLSKANRPGTRARNSIWIK